MCASLFSKTPKVTVFDNRNLPIRNIAYYRHPDTPEKTDELITHHQYDACGHLSRSADPRLHHATHSNFTCLTDLSGTALRTQSADAGVTVALNDVAGRPFMAITHIAITDNNAEDPAQAVTRTWQYEDDSLPSRLLSVTEETYGEAPRVTERLVWADSSEEKKNLNLAGQCISHYDTAGLLQTDCIALNGIPLQVTRRLLKNADYPEFTSGWQGEDTCVWNDQLSSDVYTTLTMTDATGAVLITTDATGNRQRMTYNVAGQLKNSWLTLKGRREQIIVKSLTWSAAGNKLHEEHGNGVVTTYTYQPETQRLTGIRTERPAGHTAGVRVLQELRYEYDPVGNVLSFSNDAEKTRFWRNQKIAAEHRYTYDNLYQLASATGREMAGIAQQDSRLSALIVPPDSLTYTNYTRTYTYDAGGNLTQIRHSAPASGNGYTTNITVSDRSNRAVLSTLAEQAKTVDTLFTAGGHQKILLAGQRLSWSSRGELLHVTPVLRDGTADDSESYRYDASSQRVLKVSTQRTKGSTQTQKVIYLPGLELRTKTSGGKEKENLQIITIGEAGRAQVRVLHWETGKPTDISNNQMRYSYHNLTGNSNMEVDSYGSVITQEEYYPYGGTAVWTARGQTEADYKTVRYSGKERDATGLYYYGYRYYQPWAGRWLSTDPAGSADGLNLYRMVRNNPLIYRDSVGLAPINENFNEAQGDLIYGLRYPRLRYITSALGQDASDYAVNDSSAPTIDRYNDTVTSQLFIYHNNDNEDFYDVLRNFWDNPEEYSKKISVPDNINDLVKTAKKYPLWDSYFSAGELNNKFNIASIYQEARQSPGTEEEPKWVASRCAPQLLFKRGSKLGIAMAASGAGNKIHFVLDGINMSAVVSKKGEEGQSVTASELRYAYRNKEKLAGKIHFYTDDKETEAPWDSNPELWRTYSPQMNSVARLGLSAVHSMFFAFRNMFSAFRRNMSSVFRNVFSAFRGNMQAIT